MAANNDENLKLANNKVIQEIARANKNKEQLEREKNLSIEFHRQNQHKWEMEQIRLNEKLDKHQKAANEVAPEWEKIVSKGKDWANNPQMGYDNFVSASAAQVMFICEIGPVAGKKTHVLFGGLSQTQLGQAITGLYNGVFPPDFSEPSSFIAPEITFDVAMNDDDTLAITKLDRNDGKAITPEQVMAFQSGVVAWLMGEGYNPSPTEAGKFYHKDTNEPLNQEILTDKLKVNLNLATYFTEQKVHADKNQHQEVAQKAQKIAEEKKLGREANATAEKEAAEKRAAEKKASPEQPEQTSGPRPGR